MKTITTVVSIAMTIILSFALYSNRALAQHSHGEGHGSHEMSGSHGHDHGGMNNNDDSDTGAVKIVKAGNLQAAFEIYDRAKYDEMAKSMNMNMIHGDRNSTHFIIISLMDKGDMKPVKNASLEVTVTSPNGKSARKKAQAMEGGGMFHYSADFSMKSRGNYKVTAVIHLNGEKITAKTDFTLNSIK